MTSLTSIVQHGDPAVWQAVGFEVDEQVNAFALRNGAICLVGDSEPGLEVEGIGPAAAGVVRLTVSHVPGRSQRALVDGVDVRVASPKIAATVHPNTAFELDHLVFDTDSLERTVDAIENVLGLPCLRRTKRGDVAQAFHRFDDVGDTRGCILEVVERPGATGASIMGWVANLRDLAGFAATQPDNVLSRPKPAVQPGRSIAAFRRDAGLGVRVALMSPHVSSKAAAPSGGVD